MTDTFDPTDILEIHERTAKLPEFERFTERIRLLFALPRTHLKSIPPLTEAQARSFAFVTRPPDIEYYYWEFYWAIPNRAITACEAAIETRPLGWLRMLCEIALFARVDCVDTTEWIEPRYDRLRPFGLSRSRRWVKEPWLASQLFENDGDIATGSA